MKLSNKELRIALAVLTALAYVFVTKEAGACLLSVFLIHLFTKVEG
jgi:hypothetical protein